jgi:glycosyltransferase involved in cell wall biosynthesis
VDNGTKSDVAALKARFGWVRWLEEPRVGSYVARNRGIAEAKGDVLAFTDSDCLPAANWIEAGVHALDALGATIVGGRVDYIDPGRPLNSYEIFEEMVFLLGNQRLLVEKRNISATANIFARREVIERVGPFDPDLTTFGDGAWTMGAVAQGEVLRYADTAVVQHPRRSSWRGVSRKARRVAGGKLVLMKKQRTPWTVFLIDVLRFSILDPRTHVMPFTRKGIGLWRKLKLLALAEAVSVACTWEKLQVHLGRRAFRG